MNRLANMFIMVGISILSTYIIYTFASTIAKDSYCVELGILNGTHAQHLNHFDKCVDISTGKEIKDYKP